MSLLFGRRWPLLLLLLSGRDLGMANGSSCVWVESLGGGWGWEGLLDGWVEDEGARSLEYSLYFAAAFKLQLVTFQEKTPIRFSR